MFCGKCGSSVKDGLSFCPNCGAPVNEVPEQQSISQTVGLDSQTPVVQQPIVLTQSAEIKENGFAIAGLIISLFSLILRFFIAKTGLGKEFQKKGICDNGNHYCILFSYWWTMCDLCISLKSTDINQRRMPPKLLWKVA